MRAESRGGSAVLREPRPLDTGRSEERTQDPGGGGAWCSGAPGKRS